MHEAGLAEAVADALRRELAGAPGPARFRLLVTGGHAEPDQFDDAFLFHLAAAVPELDVSTLEVVHLPVDRLCVGCGAAFAAVSSDEPCPQCGGSGLPVPSPERVEIEVERPHDRIT